MKIVMKSYTLTRRYFRFFFRILSCLFLFTLLSCDLTRRPTNTLPLDESFATFDDACQWDRGIYTELRARQGGITVTPQEYMADYLNLSAGFSSSGLTLHGWTELSPSFRDFGSIYQWYYFTLMNCNSTPNGYDALIEKTQKALAGSSADRKRELEEQIELLRTFKGHPTLHVLITTPV